VPVSGKRYLSSLESTRGKLSCCPCASILMDCIFFMTYYWHCFWSVEKTAFYLLSIFSSGDHSGGIQGESTVVIYHIPNEFAYIHQRRFTLSSQLEGLELPARETLALHHREAEVFQPNHQRGWVGNEFWEGLPFFRSRMKWSKIFTLPKFNIAPQKWWLEDYFPFGMVYFQVRTVSFRECIHLEIQINLSRI